VEALDEMEPGKDVLGFSNSRMAYDDVLSRVALSIERGSLEAKVKSSDLIELYRSKASLARETPRLIHGSLKLSGDKSLRLLSVMRRHHVFPPPAATPSDRRTVGSDAYQKICRKETSTAV
jgi:hypothetical protein